MPISQADYIAMLARTSKAAPQVQQHDGPESDLHEQILDYCASRGWLVCHSRMDRRSTVAVGMCDFIIAADLGVSYWVEVKRKGSKKPTAEQLGMIAWAKKLGHRAAIVWGMNDFLTLVNEHKTTP